jgi:hypothetical protein
LVGVRGVFTMADRQEKGHARNVSPDIFLSRAVYLQDVRRQRAGARRALCQQGTAGRARCGE